MFIILIIVLIVIILSSIRQINQYERGIKFTLGKFSKIMNPGWNIVLPIIQSYSKVDIRTKVIDVPEQETITKDNVSVRINAVIYFSVFALQCFAKVEHCFASVFVFFCFRLVFTCWQYLL